MIAKHFSEFMTPVCIHNLTVFVTVKIPEAGIDSLIEQCQIYMIPVDLYGHNPDLSARLICHILFTKPYIFHCTVCCKDLCFSCSVKLQKAVSLQYIFLVIKEVFQ